MLNTNNILKYLRSKPKQGRIPDTPEEQERKYLETEIEKLSRTLPQLTSLYQLYATVLKNVNTQNTQYQQGLRINIGFQAELAKSVDTLYKNLTYLEEENKGLAKAFGVSSKGGQKLADSVRTVYKDLVESNKEFAIGETKLFGYAQQLQDTAGGMLHAGNMSNDMAQSMLKASQIMQNNMGLSEDVSEGFILYAAGMEEQADATLAIQKKLADSISKATGIDALTIQKSITEDIGNLTADLQLQYQRIPGSLELAVLKSKALGLNMERLHTAGTNLLDIESSIGSELEYQLVSGQRLLDQNDKSLTDAYRRATIEGDANKQAELMNHLIKTQGPILEKNLFARKKAAELLGTDEATLARSIQKQKLITKLGAENIMRLAAGDMSKVAEQLRAKGVDNKDIAELLKASDTRTTAEIANDHLKNIELLTKLNISKDVDIGQTQEDLIAEIRRTGDKSISGYAQMLSGNENIIGKYANVGGVADTISAPLTKLAESLPILGADLKTIVEKLTALAKVRAGVDVHDTLIMPDRGPILRPAATDVIAAFRPNDVIDRTLKTSGGGSIDYNKLAKTFVLALSNANIQATIKSDNLYSSTKINNARRFGQG